MLSGKHLNHRTLENKCFTKFVTTLVLFLMKDLQSALAETVHFNSYGHCNQNDFSLKDDVYYLQATGAPEMHETMICEMTFRAPSDTGICLTFNKFNVECRVSLIIYQEPTASGKQWKKLTCESDSPAQMCTPKHYVTLKLVKTRLLQNKGYDFEIVIEKSSNLTGEDVILASSIGLFVGIIAGVVALIIITAVIVLCCCCKPCRSQQLQQQGNKAGDVPRCAAQQPALPTAPPAVEIEDENTPLQTGPEGIPLYPALPHPYPGTYPEQPPPYAPPPYEQHAYPTKV